MKRLAFALLALVAASGSIFFLYYMIRLATVWHSRGGSRPAGMYVGAVAFPLLFAGLGYVAMRAGRLAAGR